MAILINMLDLLKPENRRKTLELSRNEGKSVEMFALHLLESYVEGKLEWVEEEEDPEVIIESDRLEDMELSIRPYNALKKAGITKISELIALGSIEKVARIKGIGNRSLREIELRVLELGLRFGMNVATGDDDDMQTDIEEFIESAKDKYKEEDCGSEEHYEVSEEIDDDHTEHTADTLEATSSEDLYDEILSLPPTRDGVRRAFEIFSTLRNTSEQEVVDVVTEIMSGYDKEDPNTYTPTIRKFYEHLPATEGHISEIKKWGKEAGYPGHRISMYKGMPIEEISVGDAEERIEFLKDLTF